MEIFAHWIWVFLLVAEEVAIFVAIISILRRPSDTRAMWAWILALITLPVIGLLLYLTFGSLRRGRLRRRRSRRLDRLAESRQAGPQLHEPPAVATRKHLDGNLAPLATLAERVGGFPPTFGNEVTIYNDAEKTFHAIRHAVESAKSHIHMEYYIFQPDEAGHAIRDQLIGKAREGVECRLLLDYVGCWHHPKRFIRPMLDVGIQVVYTLPVIPWRGRFRANYRNHRKLVVIDGSYGFTGSQNIGDEYTGRRARQRHWCDTHMKIVGPDVQHLQEVFIQDWFYATQEDLAHERFFPPSSFSGNSIVQTVPSGPNDEHHVMHQLLFAAVSIARSSICIITPYFVPDKSMVLAFQAAAYRGVRVQIVIPTHTDHRLVLWAGRSYYADLIRADVEIYEHDETMLHSKVMVIDKAWAMVGSANMDERSFVINFELTTMLYDETLANKLYEDVQSYCRCSRKIEPDQFGEDQPFIQATKLGLARLASPLL